MFFIVQVPLYGKRETKEPLERDVVVGDAGVAVVGWGLLRVAATLLAAAAAALAATVAATAAAFTVAASADQDQIVDDDLGAVDLLAAVLVVPGARGEASFDVELVALLHVVADDLRGARVGDDVVPFGAILPLARLVLVAVGGGDREVGDPLAAGEELDLRVLAEIAEQCDLVDALCHGSLSSFVLPERRG